MVGNNKLITVLVAVITQAAVNSFNKSHGVVIKNFDLMY